MIPDVLSLTSGRPEVEYLDCSGSGFHLRAVFRGSSANSFSEFLRQAGAGVMGGHYNPQEFVQSPQLIFFNSLKCKDHFFAKASCRKGGLSNPFDLSSEDSEELVQTFKRARVSTNSEGFYTPYDVSCLSGNSGRIICWITDSD